MGPPLDRMLPGKKADAERFCSIDQRRREERHMRYRISAGSVAALLVWTAAALAASVPAAAQDFYDGKQIKRVVGVEAAPATIPTPGSSRATSRVSFPASPRSSYRTCPAPAPPRQPSASTRWDRRAPRKFGMISRHHTRALIGGAGEILVRSLQVHVCRQRRQRRAHVHHVQDIAHKDVQGCARDPGHCRQCTARRRHHRLRADDGQSGGG